LPERIGAGFLDDPKGLKDDFGLHPHLYTAQMILCDFWDFWALSNFLDFSHAFPLLLKSEHSILQTPQKKLKAS
jgi:hypothetical protein